MRIGMSIRGHGYHPAAWRHPDVPADGTLQVEHYVRSAQTAERGKLDMIFFADGAGIRQGDNPPGSLARTGRDMIELEPTMLLPALAMVTSHIGVNAGEKMHQRAGVKLHQDGMPKACIGGLLLGDKQDEKRIASPENVTQASGSFSHAADAG